jgi:putative hydrolase of the HAD superfamily
MEKYEVLYIDLDDTLYPKTNDLWQSISDRINEFMVNQLQITIHEAQALRKHYLDTYGTTLNGLLNHHEIDPIEYLDYVHDIPIEMILQPEPELRTTLEQISARKYIFTNASIQHANRVLRHLNVVDLFDGIIDILSLEFMNKPRKEAYEKALSLSAYPNPQKCMLIDDRIVNLVPAKEMGITTVLVGEKIQDPVADFVIGSLNEILNKIPGLK